MIRKVSENGQNCRRTGEYDNVSQPIAKQPCRKVEASKPYPDSGQLKLTS